TGAIDTGAGEGHRSQPLRGVGLFRALAAGGVVRRPGPDAGHHRGSIPMVQWCLPCPAPTTRDGCHNRSDLNPLQSTTLAPDLVDWPIHATNRFGGAAASPWPAPGGGGAGDGGEFGGVARGGADPRRPDYRTCRGGPDAEEVAAPLCPGL